MGDRCPGDIGDISALSAFYLFHPGPTHHRWTNESELRFFVIKEAEPNVSKEDVVHAVALFDSNRFAFECVADRDQRALPANPPACRYFAHGEVSWVFDTAQSTRELSR